MKNYLGITSKTHKRRALRLKRKIGIRKKISGSSIKPRLRIFKSAKHIYVQAIDDVNSVTLASVSTLDKDMQAAMTDSVKKTEMGAKVGEALGQKLKDNGIASAVIDRNGFKYHGRLAAVADGIRKLGILV